MFSEEKSHFITALTEITGNLTVPVTSQEGFVVSLFASNVS